MSSPSGFLRSHERFDSRLVIGPGEYTLTAGDEASCTGLPLTGLYSDAFGERVLFYRWGDALCLRTGNSPPITLDGCTADWTAATNPGEVHFRLTLSGAVLFERSYPLPDVLRTLEDDPTPFAEPEDFDLFLFVANVLDDHERSERIFRADDRERSD